ncbi:hypothetical protein [Dactylosporangium darangshiense]|uniref:hypothetical protein n=1 Tax=Dactylosporangium darangshiense TaxID=579108 RepID=UPI0031E9743F
MVGRAKGPTGRLATVAGLAAVLAVMAGLFWYGTIHTHHRIREAVAYDAAGFCPQAAGGECVEVVDAVVHDRVESESSDSTLYYLDVNTPDGSRERVRVSHEMYDGVEVGSEVQLWRFRDRTVAVEHGDLHSGTYLSPGPPYLAGLVGTLFWAVVFWVAAMLSVAMLRPDRGQTAFDAGLPFFAAVAGVVVLVVGFVLDEIANVAQFDPRLVYVSMLLAPAAAIVVVVRALLRAATAGRVVR